MELEMDYIIKCVKLATEEFNANGRSDKFIKIEDAILARKNSAEIYFFARYAKGSSVERLQDALIENGALMEAYYFQQNVEGSDIVKFANLAISKGDKFWCSKFIKLAKKTKQYNKIKHMFEGMNFKCIPEKLGNKANEIDFVISTATAEHKAEGRNRCFKQIEQYTLHHEAPANSYLFLKYTPGVDMDLFQYVTLLRGLPFSMFYVGTNVEGADRELMIQGLELAKLDYREVEKGWKEIERKKARIIYSLKNNELSGEPEYRERLLRSYSLLPKVPEYIAKIDNDYIAAIRYQINHDDDRKI